MATAVKDTLYPGTVHPPGMDAPVEFTPADVAHLQRRLRDMVAAGVPVPVYWEHQGARPKDAAELRRLMAEKTRLALGWVEDGDLDGAGVLQTRLQIPDDADRKALAKARFVSPEIDWDVQDGSGRVWPGPSITHVAVTMRPVQHWQKPFRLSLRGPLRLSLSDYRAPVRLGYGDKDMADDRDDDDLFGGADDEAGDDAPADGGEGAPLPPDPEPEAPPVIAEDVPPEVIAALKAHGIVMAPGVTKENFYDHLITALGTKTAHEQKSAAEDQADAMGGMGGGMAPGMDANNPAEVVPTNPVMMSLQAKARSLENKLLGGARARIGRRVQALAKKVDARTGKRLGEDWKAACVKLSLDAEGKLTRFPLLDTIEYLERVTSSPAHAFVGAGVKLSLSGGVEVEPPEDRLNEEEVEDSVHKLSRGRGGKAKAQ